MSNKGNPQGNVKDIPSIESLSKLKGTNDAGYNAAMKSILESHGIEKMLEVVKAVERVNANQPAVTYDFFLSDEGQLNPVCHLNNYGNNRPLSLGIGKMRALQTFIGTHSDFSEQIQELEMLSEITTKERAEAKGYVVNISRKAKKALQEANNK